ncbi:RNA-binding ATPase activator esf2 [Serendipita sp. 399]|nr:RNA-binding ATPase activator esf2 [Serendipita sp. 399]
MARFGLITFYRQRGRAQDAENTENSAGSRLSEKSSLILYWPFEELEQHITYLYRSPGQSSFGHQRRASNSVPPTSTDSIDLLCMRTKLPLQTSPLRFRGQDNYHCARLFSGQAQQHLARFHTGAEESAIGKTTKTDSNLDDKKRTLTNRLGVPLEPTWSIKAFLSETSTSNPTTATTSNVSTGSTVGDPQEEGAPLLLDDPTLDKLHRLAALQPPEKGSIQRENLRKELGELVKLVNAVRVYDVSKQEQEMGRDAETSSIIPDGRVYPLPTHIDLSSSSYHLEKNTEGSIFGAREDPRTQGRALLKHSQTATDSIESKRHINTYGNELDDEEQRKQGSDESSDEGHVEEQSESESEGSGSDDVPLIEEGEGEEYSRDDEDEENALSMEALEAYEAKQNRAGVIYISRIPPAMRPNKVRHILSSYGEIGRVYLQQEDAKRAYLRQKYTSSKKPHYTEGWVEFLDKKVARSVAEMLNAQPVGGKKGTRFREDVWTMKYLPRFKWYMLTEQIAHEHATRAAKLRMELSQSKMEQRHYLKQVELGKSLENRRERKKRKLEESLGEEQAPTAVGASKADNDKGRMNHKDNSNSTDGIAVGEMGDRNEKRRKKDGDGGRGSYEQTKRSTKFHPLSESTSKRSKDDLDAVLGSIF